MNKPSVLGNKIGYIWMGLEILSRDRIVTPILAKRERRILALGGGCLHMLSLDFLEYPYISLGQLGSHEWIQAIGLGFEQKAFTLDL